MHQIAAIKHYEGKWSEKREENWKISFVYFWQCLRDIYCSSSTEFPFFVLRENCVIFNLGKFLNTKSFSYIKPWVGEFSFKTSFNGF